MANEYILSDFLERNKCYSNVASWKQIGPVEIIVTLTDGKKIHYNASSKYTSVMRDMRPMDGEQWRKEFASRLWDQLRAKCISQSELANAIDISEATMSRIINGTVMPSAYHLNKIVAFLGCSINDLTDLE